MSSVSVDQFGGKEDGTALILFKEVMDLTHDSVVVIDESGTIIYANNSVLKVFQYSMAELEGNNVKVRAQFARLLLPPEFPVRLDMKNVYFYYLLLFFIVPRVPADSMHFHHFSLSGVDARARGRSPRSIHQKLC